MAGMTQIAAEGNRSNSKNATKDIAMAREGNCKSFTPLEARKLPFDHAKVHDRKYIDKIQDNLSGTQGRILQQRSRNKYRRDRDRAKTENRHQRRVHRDDQIDDESSHYDHKFRLSERNALRKFRKRVQKMHAAMMEKRSIKFESKIFDDSLKIFSNILNPFGEHPELMDAYGPWINLIFQLYSARSALQVWSALYSFRFIVKIRYPALIINTYDYYQLYKGFFRPDVHIQSEGLFEILSDAKMRIASSAMADTALQIKTVLSKVVTSDLVQAFRNLLLSVASQEVFSKDFTSRVYKWAGTPPKMNGFELILFCWDQLISLLKIGDSLIAGSSLSDAISASHAPSALIDRSYELLYYKDKTYGGLPVEGKKNRRDYILEIVTLRSQIQATMKITSPFCGNVKTMKMLEIQLKQAEYNVRQLVNGETRSVPAAVIIHGPPQVGKSKIIPFLATIWSRAKNREFSMQQIYSRVLTTDFLDGHDPMSQPIIHFSELGTDTAAMASRNGDAALKEVLSWCDSVPYLLNYSAVEDKGVHYAQPELLICDTNNPGLNMDVMFQNPAAFRRRFTYVGVKVKPEFRKAGSCAIDPVKSLASDLPEMDRYLLTVTTCIPISATKYREEIVGGKPDLDIYEFSDLMLGLFQKHIEEQFQSKDIGKVDVSTYLGHDDLKLEAGPADILSMDLSAFSPYERGILVRQSFRGICQTWLTSSKEFGSRSCSWMGMLGTDLVVWSLLSIALFASDTGFFEGWLANMGKKHLKFKRNTVWQHMLHLFGGDIPSNYNTNWWWEEHKDIMICAGTLLAGAILYFSLNTTSSTVNPAEKTDDEIKAEAIDLYDLKASDIIRLSPKSMETSIIEHEEKLESGKSYKRYPVSGTNLWNTREIVNTPGLFNGDETEFYKNVMRNLKVVRVETDTNNKNHILGICSNYAIINTHALGTLDSALVRISSNGITNIEQCTAFHDTIVSKANNSRWDLGNDVSLIRLNYILFRDIRKHIDPDGPGYLTTLRGYFHDRNVAIMPRIGNFNFHNPIMSQIVTRMWEYKYPDHELGMCGIPLIADKRGYQVVGIHAGGSGTSGFSVPIDINAISKIIDDHKDSFMPLANQGDLLLEGLLIDPTNKSPLNYEVLHGPQYLGRYPGEISVHQKSKIEKSLVFGQVKEIFKKHLHFSSDSEMLPPLLQPKGRGNSYVSPYNNALKKMSGNRRALNRDLLDKIIMQVSDRIILALKDRELKPLDIDSAINGAPSDPFIKSININTSAGFGFEINNIKMKKSHYFNVEDMKKIPHQNLVDRIETLLDRYSKGETAGIIYDGRLKDEVRSKEKALTGNTRMFYVAPLDYLLVSRMMLAPFYSLMVEHNELFCCSVGINMYSHADRVCVDLSDFSSLIMEGDYKAYDIKIPIEIKWAVASIVDRVLSNMGYNKYALRIVRSILTDDMWPIINVLNDLYRVPGLQPSGKYATAENNSLVGLILLMYSFYSLHDIEEHNFFDCVKPKTFGDDVLAAVSPEYADTFNNVIYQDFCLRHYGIEFTSASKSSIMEPFVSLSQMSFLKRTFRYREDIEHWVAPIDLNSIIKSLDWLLPSPNIPTLERMLQTTQSALWELALHCPKEQFDEVSKELTSLILQTYFPEGSYQFPSFNKIINQIFDGSDNGGPEPFNPPVEVIVFESSVEMLSGNALQSTSVLGKAATINSLSINLIDDSAESHSVTNKFCAENKNNNLIINDDGEPDYSIQIATLQQQLLETKSLLEKQLSGKNHQELLHNALQTVGEDQVAALLELSNYAHHESILDTLAVIDTITLRWRYIKFESGHGDMVDGHIEQVSTVGNFSDVPGAGIDFRDVEATLSSNDGVIATLPMDDFLSRPVQIYESSIAIGANVELELAVWDLFSKIPSVRAKLRNYAYLKGNLHVRISLAGSPFHAGRLLVSYQPYAYYNDNLIKIHSIAGYYGQFALNYLSQANGATTMNVNENRPLEMVLPFISPKPMFRLFDTGTAAIGAAASFPDFIAAGNLIITTMNTFSSVSATPSNPYIQVYAWMEDVEVGVPTATVMTITTESGSADERDTGPVERIASNAARVLTTMNKIPIIGPYAMASSTVASSIQQIASLFGWARPVLTSNPTVIKSKPFQSTCQVIGTETSERITLDPKQELSVDPRYCGVDSDDMSILSIAKRPSFFRTVAWTAASPIMATPIMTSKVTPTITTVLGPTGIMPTALAFSAAPFSYWRGTITYRIEIVCSKFHRGKFAIFWEPNISQLTLINGNLSYNKQFMKVIDIQETQVVDFCVSWGAYREWLLVEDPTMATVNYADISQLGYTNGYIGVVPFTSLQSPDNSSVLLNCYVYSEDIVYNVLSDTNIPRLHNVAGATGFAASSPEESRRLDVIHEDGVFLLESGNADSVTSSVPITCLPLNYSNAEMGHITHDHFGELPVSFRSLLKRYKYILNITSSPATGTGVASFRNNIIPANTCRFKPTGSAALPDVDLFSYLRMAYLGMRGGIRSRYRFRFNSANPITPADRINVSLYAPSSADVVESCAVTTGVLADTSTAGTASFHPYFNPGVEVEYPMYTNNLFLFAFSTNTCPITANDVMCGIFTRSAYIQCEFSVPITTTSVTGVREIATGEDFSFLHFRGAQFYTTV